MFTNLLKIEDKEVMETDEGAGQQAAAESMVRAAKLAACLAGCAAMTWPSSTARAAVAAALAIGLAYEVGSLGGESRSGECSNLSDREIQHELRSTEHSIRLQPRLCALRRSPAREETDQSGSHQRTSQENVRNEQEAGNTSAPGRAQSSWDVISEVDTLRDPNSSLEASNSA